MYDIFSVNQLDDHLKQEHGFSATYVDLAKFYIPNITVITDDEKRTDDSPSRGKCNRLRLMLDAVHSLTAGTAESSPSSSPGSRTSDLSQPERRTSGRSSSTNPPLVLRMPNAAAPSSSTSDRWDGRTPNLPPNFGYNNPVFNQPLQPHPFMATSPYVAQSSPIPGANMNFMAPGQVMYPAQNIMSNTSYSNGGGVQVIPQQYAMQTVMPPTISSSRGSHSTQQPHRHMGQYMSIPPNAHYSHTMWMSVLMSVSLLNFAFMSSVTFLLPVLRSVLTSRHDHIHELFRRTFQELLMLITKLPWLFLPSNSNWLFTFWLSSSFLTTVHY